MRDVTMLVHLFLVSCSFDRLAHHVHFIT